MPQTILPQTPASGAPQDSQSARSSSHGRDAGASESRFDEVSRAEQQRLEQKKHEQKQADRREEDARAREKDEASRREQSDQAAASDNDDHRRVSDSDQGKDKEAQGASEKTDKDSTTRETAHTSASSDEVTEDSQAASAGKGADEEAAPLTFAALQSLLMPSGTQAAAAGSAAAGVTGNAGAVMATTGNLIRPGMPSGQSGLLAGLQADAGSGKGLPPGAQLTDLLSANVSHDSSRPVDPTTLLASSRFQGSLDQAAQQAAQPGKLNPEASVPLRSYATSVDVPVGQAEWGDKVMGKLSWLTARNMSVAEIHLTPPDMGPMEVKVKVHNDQASVTVHAANPIVREQLENHSHRLRDMLGEQGLSLGQFDVSDQAGQQAGTGDEGTAEGGSAGSSGTLAGSDDGDMDDLAPVQQLDLTWNGQVDTFA